MYLAKGLGVNSCSSYYKGYRGTLRYYYTEKVLKRIFSTTASHERFTIISCYVEAALCKSITINFWSKNTDIVQMAPAWRQQKPKTLIQSYFSSQDAAPTLTIPVKSFGIFF